MANLYRQISSLIHLPLTDLVANLMDASTSRQTTKREQRTVSPSSVVGTNGENNPFPKRCSWDLILSAPVLARRFLGPVDLLGLGAWTPYSAFSAFNKLIIVHIFHKFYAIVRYTRPWTLMASEANLPWIIATTNPT